MGSFMFLALAGLDIFEFQIGKPECFLRKKLYQKVVTKSLISGISKLVFKK